MLIVAFLSPIRCTVSNESGGKGSAHCVRFSEMPHGQPVSSPIDFRMESSHFRVDMGLRMAAFWTRQQLTFRFYEICADSETHRAFRSRKRTGAHDDHHYPAAFQRPCPNRRFALRRAFDFLPHLGHGGVVGFIDAFALDGEVDDGSSSD